MTMIRTFTDVLIGLSLGLLVASLAGGFYVAAARADCHAAEVEASTWTSSNTDPTFPASALPQCAPWEKAMQVALVAGLGSGVAAAGLGAIRVGNARMRAAGS